MITRIRLFVDVNEFVAWRHYECRSELRGSAAGVVLPIALCHRTRPRQPCIRSERCRGSQLVQHNGVCCGPVLVEKYWEGNVLVLDERRCVSSTTGANSCDARSGRCQLFISVSDLTGPFSAGQSAEVSEKEKDMRFVRPQVAEPVKRSVGVRKGDVREGIHD